MCFRLTATSGGGFLSTLNHHRKLSSDPGGMTCPDDDDDYAEPGPAGSSTAAANTFSLSNVYTQATAAAALPPPAAGPRNLPPLPISHYARPLSPPQRSSVVATAASSSPPDRQVSRNSSGLSFNGNTANRYLYTGYLCHFSTEMTEIWSPGTLFEHIWTHKISALYLFYFKNDMTLLVE